MYPEEYMNNELRGLFDEVVKGNTRDDCSIIMMSRAKIIEAAKLHGLKRKQVLGLLRELSRKKLIRKNSFFSRS